jgi:hypothetical protein
MSGRAATGFNSKATWFGINKTDQQLLLSVLVKLIKNYYFIITHEYRWDGWISYESCCESRGLFINILRL